MYASLSTGSRRTFGQCSDVQEVVAENSEIGHYCGHSRVQRLGVDRMLSDKQCIAVLLRVSGFGLFQALSSRAQVGNLGDGYLQE